MKNKIIKEERRSLAAFNERNHQTTNQHMITSKEPIRTRMKQK
jgi:hypothetical protein